MGFEPKTFRPSVRPPNHYAALAGNTWIIIEFVVSSSYFILKMLFLLYIKFCFDILTSLASDLMRL